MQLENLLSSEEFWAWLIMHIWPKAFDLFEQLLQFAGVYDWIDTPTRKTALAYIFSIPASIVALGVLSLLWPEAWEFQVSWVSAFAVAIASIISTETYLIRAMRSSGVLKSSIRRITSFQVSPALVLADDEDRMKR